MTSPPERSLFGIYVHWPYCASKCPYCDFNSHVAAAVDHDLWRDAYRKEIAHYAALTPSRTVTSIFFGGGTPSLMEPETVQVVIDAAAAYWNISDNVEITLEANPTSVEAEKFSAFRAAGVNRVSIGVQSLNDDDLAFLGRKHSASEAVHAVETAARTFDRYSFDLIYARPQQTLQSWRKELEKALALSGGHLSLYQLTIEEGTPFYMRHGRGEFSIPDQELAGEFFEETQEIMNKAGMSAYEVSNHAQPGDESIHNMTYWRYDDYAGIGPGAHGRLTLGTKKLATRGHRSPDVWLERAVKEGHGAQPFEELSHEDRFTECLMMGLRLREGVSLPRLSEESGRPWRDALPRERLEALVRENLVEINDNRLRPTRTGLQRVNGLLRHLL